MIGLKHWACNPQALGSSPGKVNVGNRKSIRPYLLLCLIEAPLLVMAFCDAQKKLNHGFP